MASSKDDLASLKSSSLSSGGDQESCIVQGELYVVFRLTQLLGLTPVTFEKVAGVRRMRLAPIIWRYFGFFFMTACNTILILNIAIKFLDNQAVKDHLNYSSIYNHMITVTIILATSASVYGAPMRIRSLVKFLNQIHMINSNIGNLYCNALFEDIYGFITWAITALSLITAVSIIFIRYYVIDELKVYSYILIFSNQFAHALVLLTLLQFMTCAKEVYTALQSINEALEDLLQSPPNNKTAQPGDIESKLTADTIHNLAFLYATACEEIKRLNDSNGVPILCALVACNIHFIYLVYGAIEEITSENCRWIDATNKIYASIMKMFWILIVIEPCHFTSVEIERTGDLLNKLNLKYNDKATSLELNYFIRYFLLNKVEFSPMGMITLNRPLLASIAARLTTYLVLIFQFRNLELSI